MKKILILLILTIPFFLHGINIGDEGYVLTVFSGMYPDTVPAKVVGIMPSSRTSSKGGSSGIIMIRMYGKADSTGVAAGMSGSPLYINGKIVGAVAYTWGFGKEPYAGVVPIDEMKYWINNGDYKGNLFPYIKNKQNLDILISGNITDDIEYIAKEIGATNIMSSGSFYDTLKVPEIKPGMSIGALLIDGDLKVSAIGTATYTDKDYIVAFGHPLFNMGKIDIPACPVYVHFIYPSYQLSFKVGTPLNAIGAIVEDRDKGVVIKKGKKSYMIPVKINVNDKEFNYKIANVPKLVSYLTSMCLINSVQSASFLNNNNTILYVETTIFIDTLSLRYQNIYHTNFILRDVISIPNSLIDIVFNNTYETPRIDSISIITKMKSVEGRGFIEDIYVPFYKYSYKDTIKGKIKVRRFGGSDTLYTFSLPVPPSYEGKKLKIVAEDASSFIDNNISIYPDSLYVINKKIRDFPMFNQIVVSLYGESQPILRNNRKETKDIPNAVKNKMTDNPVERKWISLKNVKINTNYILSGLAYKNIEIVFKEEK